MVTPPKLPDQVREALIEEEVERAVEEGLDVESCHFYGEELPNLAGETVEFFGCILKNARFALPARSGWCLWTACWIPAT